MIPFIGYSQTTILEKEKTVSKYQLQQVLKDKIALDYYIQVDKLNDSLIELQEEKIYDLQQSILEYRSIEQNLTVGINSYRDKFNSEKRKNKLLKIGSGVIVSGLVYLYIQK